MGQAWMDLDLRPLRKHGMHLCEHVGVGPFQEASFGKFCVLIHLRKEREKLFIIKK